ncbi:hypothetical protein TWF730_002792 [Orbilia blumenaviensis]|uniref:Uncharacterized protein n=1 Tax=Orbilia blumenaviensis TaxID=1796055 RepID=A0AAV9U9T6_9PEZI
MEPSQCMRRDMPAGLFEKLCMSLSLDAMRYILTLLNNGIITICVLSSIIVVVALSGLLYLLVTRIRGKTGLTRTVPCGNPSVTATGDLEAGSHGKEPYPVPQIHITSDPELLAKPEDPETPEHSGERPFLREDPNSHQPVRRLSAPSNVGSGISTGVPTSLRTSVTPGGEIIGIIKIRRDFSNEPAGDHDSYPPVTLPHSSFNTQAIDNAPETVDEIEVEGSSSRVGDQPDSLTETHWSSSTYYNAI